MSSIHLVAGPMGAGKTTHALKLAQQTGGLHFSIDEWMMTLFAPDITDPIDPAWMWERVGRCEKQITALALQAATQNIPVILDLGFQRAEHRKTIAEIFRAHGHEVQWHWLDADVSERWNRISERNNQKGDTYKLTITKPMFDFMESRWEAPSVDEKHTMTGADIL